MFSDTCNFEFCVKRLWRDYEKHANLIIAFDFDNTIYDYHNERYHFDCVKSLLRDCSELGFTMVLFTANDDPDTLQHHIEFCEGEGIRVDFVNESPVLKTTKPYYNILLDDRAGLEDAYHILSQVVKRIKNERLCKQ